MLKNDHILLVVGKFQKSKTDLKSIFSDKCEFLIEILKKLGLRKSILLTSEAY